MSVRVLFDHACARWRPWRSWRGRGEFTLLSVDVCGGVFSFRSDDVVHGREKKVKVKRREREREVTDRTRRYGGPVDIAGTVPWRGEILRSAGQAQLQRKMFVELFPS